MRTSFFLRCFSTPQPVISCNSDKQAEEGSERAAENEKKKRGRVRWSEVRACECEREHLHSATWDNFINLLSILNNRFWRSANLLYNVHNPYPLTDNPPPPLSDLANPSFGSGLAQPLKLSHRDKSSHPLALCALLCCITVFSEGDAGGW